MTGCVDRESNVGSGSAAASLQSSAQSVDLGDSGLSTDDKNWEMHNRKVCFTNDTDKKLTIDKVSQDNSDWEDRKDPNKFNGDSIAPYQTICRILKINSHNNTHPGQYRFTDGVNKFGLRFETDHFHDKKLFTQYSFLSDSEWTSSNTPYQAYWEYGYSGLDGTWVDAQYVHFYILSKSVVDSKYAYLANWMQFIPDSNTLNQIMLIGSHDAGMSYEQDSQNSYSTYGPDATLTQQYKIYNQMLYGTRYFDIRPGTQPDDEHRKKFDIPGVGEIVTGLRCRHNQG